MSPVPTSDSSHDDRLLVVIGGVSGACVALATLASATGSEGASWLMVLIQATVAAQGGAALLWVVRASLRWAVGRVSGSHAVRDAYMRDDTATYAVFLLTLATALGVQLAAPVLWVLLAFFVAAQWMVLRKARPARTERAAAHDATRGATVVAALLLTGFTLTLYGAAWARMLERSLGATAGVASLFAAALLVGLGVGVLAGGRASRAAPRARHMLCVVLQLAAAGWGVASLSVVPSIAAALAPATQLVTAAALLTVTAAPMLLIGATLPLLAAERAVLSASSSRPTMALYGATGLGAAGVWYLTVDVLFAFVGLCGIVWAAIGCGVLGAVAPPIVHALRRRVASVEGT